MNRKPGQRWVPHTASEWALLGGVALLSISVSVPPLLARQRTLRRLAAQADIAVLRQASLTFFSEYGRWPGARPAQGDDPRYGHQYPNQEFLHALRSVEGPGNLGYAQNPKRIVFLEVGIAGPGRSGLDAQGEFLDPWGQPYQIVPDADLDDVCRIPYSAYGPQEQQGIVIWSYGPDKRSDSGHDILSWKIPFDVVMPMGP